MQHIFECLSLNDYPDWILKQCVIANLQKQTKERDSPSIGCVVLPFIPNFSYTLKCILNEYGINVYFKLHKTIKCILDKLKDSVDPNSRKCAIYEIPCAECQQVYVGETDQSFNTRCR